MSENKAGMFIPALIGGTIAGVLSGIPLVNCLCCLWIIGGGIIAAHFLAKESPTPLTSGDGAIVGVFAGLIAAVVDFLVSIPLAPITNNFLRGMFEKIAEYAEEMPAGWEDWLESNTWETSIPMFFFGLVINAVIFSLLSALGGIIGVSLFKRKSAPASQGVIDVPKDSITSEDTDNNQS